MFVKKLRFFKDPIRRTGNKLKITALSRRTTNVIQFFVSRVQTDLSKRLGNLRNGMADIKNHPWFRTVDWLQIINQKVDAPFKPNMELLSKGRKEASFWITEKDYFDFWPLWHDKIHENINKHTTCKMS